MSSVLKRPIWVSRLAKDNNLSFTGADRRISRVDALSALQQESLGFAISAIPEISFPCAIVTHATQRCPKDVTQIISDNPRLDFIRILCWLDNNIGFKTVNKKSSIARSVKIGRNVVIGKSVKIGSGTIIGHNVVIGDGVVIGKNCVIKSAAVIGEDGFGFERNQQGIPLRMKHFGSVVIGNEVEIGSLTTVCRGVFANTVIEDHVKIDDHVHIAHNCHIQTSAIIVACAEISGGCKIGVGAWVAPNASILEGVTINNRAFLGLGTVVLKDVEERHVVVGNPARMIRKMGENE